MQDGHGYIEEQDYLTGKKDPWCDDPESEWDD